ncbi:uncharacterized protein TNIN_377561 [Trichonephila inaurata madagascariensis]|uniref:DUF4503 domain-containing protein n=1 Tax=Trichonephila inaurata madagascariensis TaxID=2747483 RepID=A0A8X6YEN4_9ARAC|nr:uncharacterized protein TNIN_377561 [Trichonephila inaurata madagascariensis]
MNNNLSENLQCQIPFLNFKTKQHVSKSKLGEELVKKGWNVFTSGFSQNNAKEQVNPFVKGKETIITKLEWDPEVLRKQVLAEGYKSKKRKPVELKAEFISHRTKSLCTLAHEKSFQQHAIKEKCHPLKKCTNPVFLEVQNIQNSFHQNESGNLAKPAIKFSSNSCGDFNSENGPKRNKGQENVPKKGNPSQIPITLPSDKFLSSMSVQKVKKINFCSIQSLEMNDNSLIKPDIHDKKTTDVKLLTINTESRMKKEVEGFKDLKFHLTAVNVVDMKIPNVHSLKPFTLEEEESSGNKGSSWVQSLVHIDNEGTSYEDPIGKRKIRNIIPGGFAEQVVKLQRREKSEKVIWEHKIDRNNKKGAGNTLSLILISVLWIHDFVIAKCVHSQPQASDSHRCLISDSEEKTGLTYQFNETNNIVVQSKIVIVLFKKSIFCKLHLKIQSMFQICPPWQTLFLPSMSCPIILCASFIDFDPPTSDSSKFNQAVDKNLFLVSDLIQMTKPKSLVHRQDSFCPDELFFKSEEPVSLLARVQRIWKLENRKLPSKSVSNYLGYLLLLQEKGGTFHEILLFFCHSLPNVWRDFVSCCEGKCYTFSNLHVIQRLCSNRHLQFFKFLKLISSHENKITELNVKQEFCYQLMFNSISDVPKGVSGERFPDYCAVSIQPLVALFRGTPIQRFSCIGKVLFQYSGMLYISDESLLLCNPPKYMQIQFLSPLKEKSSFVGSSVYVKEALFLEGCLLLDNYSKFRLLSESSDIDEELKLLSKIKLRQLAKVNLQSIISPISANSRVSEFITVEGEVTDVDESSALTWLQCNLCLHENLVQDSNLVIYCEDCSRVVPKPILNVKMVVTLSCICKPSIVVQIQLLSITIKKILQISEDNYQPKCNVSDVLGKKIGPLFGYIKRCSTERNIQIFHVSEISTS